MLGWRKLTAWFLVFLLTVWSTHTGSDVPERSVELLKWVTTAFFGANALKPTAAKLLARFEVKKVSADG